MPEPPSRKSPHPVDVKVGQRLRARRDYLRLSQTMLADHVGITFQQIQKYENGKNRISASRLWAFAQLLEVPISYFFDPLPYETPSPTRERAYWNRVYDELTPELRRDILKIMHRLVQDRHA